MSIANYGRERISYLQTYATRLGVTLSVSSPYYDQILRGCLQAELDALDVVFDREGGKPVSHIHPDSINGPWQQKAPPIDMTSEVVASISAVTRGAGKSLDECIDEWIRDRERLKKKVDAHLVTDMRATIKRFQDLTKITDVGLVERKHVIRFRDHLTDHAGYKVATVNKKIGFLTTMVVRRQMIWDIQRCSGAEALVHLG